jgi:GNAT superfamily N-acetyltransferase
MSAYRIRPATVEDAATIARHRVRMFQDMGEINDAASPRLLSTSASAIAVALKNGTYLGWLATDDHAGVIGGAGVHVKPQLPRPTHDGSAVAISPVPLVVNVYTEPEWRRRGIARALLTALLEWARSERVDRVLLHASAHARELYKSLGFVSTNEMRWRP